MNNSEVQRSSLLIQNTREPDKGFLSNTLHTNVIFRKKLNNHCSTEAQDHRRLKYI